MAQGNVRAFHFAASGAVPFARIVNRGVAHCAIAQDDAAGGSLVPTPVAPALRVTGANISGQALAGSGALVFEGEVLESIPARRPAPPRSH